ncbi:MAG: adaptor protein MecA [Eubacteriales bacterium]|nr:adaptor protein MecA [Eubacteriales bacterium]
MKIEKISENQIRCILTKEDLEHHQIRLSELAYGTEKAKKLFRDMMQQAQIQFGFEADNIPLMVEAIPVSMESIILIITKVEDPEELDTRFSKFSPYRDNAQKQTIELDGADSIIDIFNRICDAKMKKLGMETNENDAPDVSEAAEQSLEDDAVSEEDGEKKLSVNLIRQFTFHTLDDVIAASQGLNGFFDGINTLYKGTDNGYYQLVIHQSDCTPQKFNKVCNILSEYGSSRPLTASGEAYLQEHGELITKDALQQLTQL